MLHDPYVSSTGDASEDQSKQQSFECFLRTVWAKLPTELGQAIFLEVIHQLVVDAYPLYTRRGLAKGRDVKEYKRKLSPLCLMSQASCRAFRLGLFFRLRLDSVDDIRELWSILNTPTLGRRPIFINCMEVVQCKRDVPQALRSSVFAALLGHVRTLRTLEIKEITRLDTPPPEPLPPLPSSLRQRARNLRSLISLTMSGCIFSTPSDALRFLGDFPSLRDITLYAPIWDNGAVPQWSPDVCGSAFQKIVSVSVEGAISHSTFIPSWIFATTCTRFQPPRKRARLVYPVETLSPRREIIEFASTLENIIIAQDSRHTQLIIDREYRFEMQYQGEGTSANILLSETEVVFSLAMLQTWLYSA